MSFVVTFKLLLLSFRGVNDTFLYLTVNIVIFRLTGREMLTLFASLHGVKNPQRSTENYIKQLGIQKVSSI